MFLKRFFNSALAIAMFIFAMAGCRPEYLNKEELVDYINDPDNGAYQVQNRGGVEVAVSYKPTDLLILQENGWKQEIAQEKYETLKQKYEGQYYFTLRLSQNSKEVVNVNTAGPAGFSALVETLSFRMGEFTHLTTKTDTVAVADYIFSRTYGMSNSNDLLFVFSKDEAKNNEWVQLNLKEFGLGLGNLTFRFKTKDLVQIPKIEFKEVI